MVKFQKLQHSIRQTMIIAAAKVVTEFHLPYESMGIFEGTITENKRNQENNYTMDFDSVLWSGFRGFVVLLNEPTKLCGMFTRLQEDNSAMLTSMLEYAITINCLQLPKMSSFINLIIN